MADMQEIELQCAAVAVARAVLADRVRGLEATIEAFKRDHLPGIREAAQEAVGDIDRLRVLIKESPELFEKPRTRLFHDVRCGYTKQRGQVVIANEEKTIERIRAQLPKEQAELLIRTREAVHKPAVYDLTAGDLKRLGITIEADTDAVVIKTADTAIDKIVDALLKDAESVEEAAA